MILLEINWKKIQYCRNNSKIKYQNRRKEPKSIPPNVHTLSRLGTGTPIIKSGVAKLVIWFHTYPLNEQNSVKQLSKNKANDST